MNEGQLKDPRPATEAHRVHVALGDNSYDILIGPSLLGEAGRHIKAAIDPRRVLVLTDETVAALHLDELQRALADAGIRQDSFVLPAGEQSKSFAQLGDLVGRLLDARIERGTPLIALGGGVIGDLVGFAAAIVLRGLPFIQIPTTLLAQVDSSVGGKTAINVPQGKNLVGAFHQPRLVLADTEALSTLPRREILAGYAEVAKYGLINDDNFFAWLEGHGTAVIEGEPEARAHAIAISCAAKAAIVSADEREAGQRALLNLGHTFGHALEAETGYSDELLHGEAVAIGMVMAFDLSVQLGLCPPEDAARVRRHLASLGLPTGLEGGQGRIWTTQPLLESMGHDKKVQDGRITFVLTRGIGKAFLTREVEMDDVALLLNAAVAA